MPTPGAPARPLGHIHLSGVRGRPCGPGWSPSGRQTPRGESATPGLERVGRCALGVHTAPAAVHLVAARTGVGAPCARDPRRGEPVSQRFRGPPGWPPHQALAASRARACQGGAAPGGWWGGGRSTAGSGLGVIRAPEPLPGHLATRSWQGCPGVCPVVSICPSMPGGLREASL